MQKYILWGAAAIAVLIFLFPPVNLEKRVAFNSVNANLSRTLVEINTQDFQGWKFIGQSDIHTPRKPVWVPEDPDNVGLYDRLMAPGPSTPVEEAGVNRIAFGLWLLELISLAVLAGGAWFFAGRSGKKPKT